MSGEASEGPRLTAVERERRRRSRRHLLTLLGVLAVVAAAGYWWYLRNVDAPIDYVAIDDQFKYGSIGSDNAQRGLPLAVLAVLPQAFPHLLPPGAPADYTAFGLIQEPGQTLPIGFSQRQNVIPLAGLNCAVCHTSTVRATPESDPVVHVGMPANTVNLEAVFEFLFEAAADEGFTPERLMPLIEAEMEVNALERWVLRRRAIPMMRAGLLAQRSRLAYMFDDDRPRAGPGRIDTFGPYKAIQYRFPMGELPEAELIGTADFPSIWNQAPREGLALHWDGNNASVFERNFSAAFGAGATPSTVDIERLEQLADWLAELPPPTYPFAIDADLAAAGEPIYQQNCYSCHAGSDFGPDSQARRETSLGEVMSLSSIGTDPYRLRSFTPELAVHQATLMAGTPYRLESFRTTDGYVNMPLDGIWLRAPYLHNGSVPTLADLLTPAEERPRSFYRGYDVYDPVAVGFVSDVPEEGGRQFFLFETHTPEGEPIPGNSNQGHEYGTALSDGEKLALIEYMKTL
ncbi:MAG: cytochrome c [Gemmatimonadota bacterium]